VNRWLVDCDSFRKINRWKS